MPHKDPEALKAYKRRYYEQNKARILARVARYAAENAAAVAARYAAWAAENADKRRAARQRYDVANSDAVRAYRLQWRQKNPEARREVERRYFDRFPEKRRAKTSARRAARLRRTPPWFGELDALVVREAADLCVRRHAVTGFAWHIDHVIPLRGRTVSGLHVWNNLQVIPAALNIAKRNSYDPQER